MVPGHLLTTALPEPQTPAVGVVVETTLAVQIEETAATAAQA
jgi:hypothetical protein